jgi:4-alpha-glucanotransferase
MYLYHDSRQAAYRTPFGAVSTGTQVTLCLDAQVPEESQVFLRLWQTGETLLPMTGEQGRFSVTFSAPEEPGLLWYYFQVIAGGVTYYYGREKKLSAVPPESWQITVYQPMDLPEWYGNSVAYQIFPDRFARGENWQTCQSAAAHPEGWQGTKRLVVQDWNDTPFYCKDSLGRVTRWPFFGGNLEGIREKLPYLKSLGVGVLYLNPIFAASSNHKYDTADYLTIDPAFGDEEAFSRLCREAADMGIRILLDGVFSHTGDDSVYFNRYGNFPGPGAFSSEESPYDSWYRFGEEYPQGYSCWWGVDSLPEVEETDPGYESFICGENGVVRKWLRLGASGWRLDVADELPDSFIRALRRAAQGEKPDALLLGEVWEDASNKISYGTLREYLLGQELDCTMHYPFRTGTIDFLLGRQSAEKLAESLETIRENYPPSALYGALNLAGTHDTPRILTVLGEAPEGMSPQLQEEFRLDRHHRHLAGQRLRLLQVMQFTSPGVPCIYYGDEAGTEGYADPYNRSTFPWGREDQDLTGWVRRLSHLRQEYPVLIRGTVAYGAASCNVFSMERTLEDASVRIYVNRSWDPEALELDACRIDLLTGQVFSGKTVTVPGMSALVLYREGNAPEAFSQLPQKARIPQGKGVLLPVFSLPGNGPVGNFRDALRFLDVVKAAGYDSWMLLPLCPPGDGDSPYSSPCIFAGDTRYIAPDLPVDMGGFSDFCQENHRWLEDYALYRVLRQVHGRPWQDWPWRERDRKNLKSLQKKYAAQIRTVMEEQYRFFAQWSMVREKAEELGIALIGDLPIYAALDSAETWAHREEFLLDSTGHPTLRSGCPPDYFAPEGQDWGNPLYHWAKMEEDGYSWWKQRLRQAFSCFHYVRLDHFRSFAAYYAIPTGKTAKEGHWMKGAGVQFFREMAKEFGNLPIVAEDLGALDSQVTVLLRHTGLAGMNVWQFSGAEMAAMPPELAKNRVFFSGTHDNQTLKSFLQDSGDCRTVRDVLAELENTPAASVIFPVQDLLELDDHARINVPGIPTGNWTWRMTQEQMEQLEQLGHQK